MLDQKTIHNTGGTIVILLEINSHKNSILNPIVYFTYLSKNSIVRCMAVLK